MKNYLKKSLAFLLAFMMVFSYIAYVEPIEADAKATIDTYRKADKYGTPVWDGSDTYYSRWNSGSSYTTFTWPKHIYMDISETLESAGYYYTVEWDYGNGTNYRIVNNGFIFGGWGLQNPSNWPENYNTMNTMFNNYDLDASTHGTQLGVDTESSTDFDLRVGGDNWDGAAVIIWRNPGNDNNAQHQYVFMKGSPKTTGYGLYSTSGAKPTSFGGWQEWKKPNIFASTQWTNASDKYVTGNDSSNWTTDCYEGTWKEVRFEITVYDKSDLNYAKQKSDTILSNITPYLSYNTAGYDNYIAQHNATANVLKTREVTQAGLTTQITTLSTAANALSFAASNSALMTAISNARTKMAEVDYATKYTEASRTALETALNNATASSYDDGIATYAINFSDNSTWNAGEKAAADQTAINNYATAINNAIAGLKNVYSITFEFANGTTNTDVYDDGATVSVPANSTKASDAENHYSYSWSPDVSTTANANATYTEVLETAPHSWSDWTQTKDPSCTAEGSKQRECTECRYVETGSVDMIDHKPVTTEANRVEASCSTDGSYDLVTYCDVCGDTIKTEHKIIPATGEHVYATEKEKVEATCTEDGYVIMTCGCGATEKTVFTATGHTSAEAVTENFVEATCTAEGSYDEVVYCKNCSTELSRIPHTIDKVAHEEDEAITENLVEATCTAEGSYDEVVYCKNCSTELSRTPHTIDKIAHEAAEAVTENLVEATCTAEGSYDEVVYCKNCFTELSRTPHTIDKIAHEEDEAVTENLVEATCTAEGSYDEVVYCKNCTTELSRTPHTIDKATHEEDEAVTENLVEATCTAEGSYDKVVYCKNCPEELSRTPVNVPMADHAYVDHEAQPPTCSVDGWEAYKTCENCDYTTYKVIEATGEHVYAAEKEKVEATCLENGYVIMACGCGAEEKTELKATGHDWGEWAVETPATCTEDGVEKRVCKNDAAHFETNPIAATGEHVYATEKEKVEATCFENGYVIMACECGAEERTELKATGHDWGEWVVETPATCTEDGVEKRVCKNDAAHFETNPIAATGEHVYATEKEKVEATCLENGYVIMACECGAEEKTKLKATGHDWGKWEETKAPTATEEGEETRTCGNCGESETRSVPALGTDTDEPTPDQPQKPVDPDEPVKGSCDRCGTVHTNIFQKLICLLMDLMHRVLNILTGGIFK